MKNKIALAGVPNCGKTTLWNLSTGRRSKTGNWPGVTNEKLSAPLRLFPDTELTDLPGTYSLSGKNPEELCAKNYLLSGESDSIIIIIDGTKPEQGLYFALELLSLKKPSVIGINFSDELQKRKIYVDIEKLSAELGSPVFLISAKKRINTDELISCAKNLSGTLPKNVPSLSENERRKKASLLAEKFFSSQKNSSSAYEKTISFVAFLVLTAVLFFISSVLKKGFLVFLEHFTAVSGALLNFIKAGDMLRSLVTEGIIPGAGAVFSFVPDLFTVFLLLSFLEDSGYMARAAFYTDFLLKKIGLSGRSVIPLLIGSGCTVPAVCSLKNSGSGIYKKRTLSALMFVPCGARLPLLLLFCREMFSSVKFTAVFFYLSVLMLGALFLKLSAKKISSSFVLEIPKIRIPSLKSILKTAGRRLFSFLTKASGMIVLTSVLIWVLKNFSLSLEPVELESESALFSVGNFLSPIFSPCGIPPHGAIALFCGLFAKEAALFSLVSFSEDVSSLFGKISAVSFLLFYLIYSPCPAALVSIKNEFGAKTALRLFLRQNILAYFVSFAFYQLAVLIFNIFSP